MKTAQLRIEPHLQMSSCPITPLVETLAADDTPPTDLTDRDRHDLVAVLAEVPDPRDPRGIRYPLASLLAVAVCAVLAGAVTFAAIADWVEDLPDTGAQALVDPSQREALRTA